MATITVYGGDFKAGRGTYSSKQFNFKSDKGTGIFFGESIPLDRLAKLETVSLENNGRDTGSTVGRALVGELLAGPFGAIIAAGTAKGRNQVTFLATFDDNRQFLGATDSETFKTWMGTLLTRRRMEENETARAAAKINTEMPRAPSAIRQQVPVAEPTANRRIGLAIAGAVFFVITIAIFSGESRRPPQQQALAVLPKPQPLDIDAQCNISGAIPNCKEELPKMLAKEAAFRKLALTTIDGSASTPSEKPPSSKELEARKEAALRQCWANANAAAARSGFKLSPQVVANPGLVNADVRNMYLTANELIEERTCEAGARMDNGGYSTFFNMRTYKGSDGKLHALD